MPPKATARAARAAKRGGEEIKSKTTQKKKKSRTLPTAANAPSSRPPSRASSAPSSRPPSRASVAASVADDQQDSGPSRKKNLNWIEEEDVYLCKAYVNITQDGARATNQTAETFWKRISESFMEQQSKCEVCQEKKRPIRDWGACQSRLTEESNHLRINTMASTKPSKILIQVVGKRRTSLGKPLKSF